ncbi:MAG: CheR family methyltransferase, partial [Bosea sp. (in: a-proteobacteria)]
MPAVHSSERTGAAEGRQLARVTVFDSEQDLSEPDFKLISELLYREAGIVVRAHKQAMVRGRMARLARDAGAPSIAAYCQRLRGADATQVLPDLINALTTNHTSFYREDHHFAHLEQVALPAIMANPALKSRLRIWCAAASSGEEPYTIAATLHAFLKGARHADSLILATDIDSAVLAAARVGTYPAASLARLSENQRARLLATP